MRQRGGERGGITIRLLKRRGDEEAANKEEEEKSPKASNRKILSPRRVLRTFQTSPSKRERARANSRFGFGGRVYGTIIRLFCQMGRRCVCRGGYGPLNIGSSLSPLSLLRRGKSLHLSLSRARTMFSGTIYQRCCGLYSLPPSVERVYRRLASWCAV